MEAKEKYLLFIDKLEKKIQDKKFINELEKYHEIDKKHCNKFITIGELENVIKEYKKLDVIDNNFKKIQIITIGNPETIFRLCIEAIRYSISITFSIDDFCLAQNMFIVNIVNLISKELKLGIKLELENSVSIDIIIQKSQKYERNICIGDVNRYNALCESIENIEIYPYNVYEMYTDSDEFDELKEKIYNYASINGYELDIIDEEMKIDDVVEEINNNGYGFCAIIFSKDKEKCEKFRKNIKSDYVIVNENPFTKVKFKEDFLFG